MNSATKIICWLCGVLCLGSAFAGELDECARLAPKYKAKTEVRLEDGSRVDLLSDDYAIEVDYPKKWAESIGQSLHYAELTGKKPGVILLLSDPATEWQFLVRAARLCGKYGIALYIEMIDKKTEIKQPE
jgi:hypothetical protein